MTSLDSCVTLGRSGLRVSPLSLGTMTFGEDSGWGASPEIARSILAEYLDRGGNIVDTANTYSNGNSEKIIGDFFAARPGLRDRVVLGTKFFANLHPGPHPTDQSAPTAAAAIRQHRHVTTCITTTTRRRGTGPSCYCHDCHQPCVRIDVGGLCPTCDTPVTISDILDQHPAPPARP